MLKNITKLINKKTDLSITRDNIAKTAKTMIGKPSSASTKKKNEGLGNPWFDYSGSLKMLTQIFENLSANIVQIDYDRDSVALDFGDANVTISLETKGEEHQQSIRDNLKNAGYRFREL